MILLNSEDDSNKNMLLSENTFKEIPDDLNIDLVQTPKEELRTDIIAEHYVQSSQPTNVTNLVLPLKASNQQASDSHGDTEKTNEQHLTPYLSEETKHVNIQTLS